MVLIVIGVWLAMASIARAIMQPVYKSGLISLRTASKTKRISKLSRVIATPWIYTMVFIMMFTAFVGMGILRKDTADFFGFQKHVLSWEYILHPKYVVLLCLCTLLSSGIAVATFRIHVRRGPASSDKYDKAWNNGFKAFIATGLIGFLFILILEAARSVPESPITKPRGEAIAKAIAIIVATKSAFRMVSGKPKAYMQDLVNALMYKLDIDETTINIIKTFADTLPNRTDDSSKSVEQRMIASGFDPETSRSTKEEVNNMRMYMLKYNVSPEKSITRVKKMYQSPGILDGLNIDKDKKKEIEKYISESNNGAPLGIMALVANNLQQNQNRV